MSEKPTSHEVPFTMISNEKSFHKEDDLCIKDYAIASSINGIAIGSLNGVVTYVTQLKLSASLLQYLLSLSRRRLP